MHTYIILLRGINVGGKNSMPMKQLKSVLEKLGCENVSTYIQSGNVLVQSTLGVKALTDRIEAILPKEFKLDTSILRVLVLTDKQFARIIQSRPKGFGEQPEKYHSDVIFLMDIPADEAIKVFNPKDGVDTIWKTDAAIFSQRLSSKRTQSRLSKIVGTKVYKSMTIRNWNTVTKLLQMAKNTAIRKTLELIE